jgi:hypothetical protein
VHTIATAWFSGLLLWMHDAAVYLGAHPNLDLGILLFLLGGLANKLQSRPWGKPGIVATLRKVIDFLSPFPHEDAVGIFGHMLDGWNPPNLYLQLVKKILWMLLSWWNLPIVPSYTLRGPSSAGPSSTGTGPSGPIATLILLALLPQVGCTLFQSRGSKIAQAELHCLESIGVEIVHDVGTVLANANVPPGATAQQLADAATNALITLAVKYAPEAIICAVGAVASGLFTPEPQALPTPAPALSIVREPVAPAAAALIARTCAVNSAATSEGANALYSAEAGLRGQRAQQLAIAYLRAQ